MPSHRLAAFALLTLAACGKEDASSSTGAAPASATAAAPKPTAAATAAPKPTATAAPAPAACTFPGTWTGTYPPGPYPFSGQPFDFTLRADGSALTHSARADQEFAWKVEGGALTLHSVKVEHGGRFACSKDDVGKYKYRFTPDCSGFTLELAQDPCKGRSKTLDGASLKRK